MTKGIKIKSENWSAQDVFVTQRTSFSYRHVSNLLDPRKETLLFNFWSQFIVVSVSVERTQLVQSTM